MEIQKRPIQKIQILIRQELNRKVLIKAENRKNLGVGAVYYKEKIYLNLKNKNH